MFRQKTSIKIKVYFAVVVVSAVHAVPWMSSACAQSAFTHEYQIKAAFLYKFANFIDGWKFQQKEGDEKSAKADRPLLLGIIGEDPFKDSFVSLKDKKVLDRKVVIKYFKGLSQSCSARELRGELEGVHCRKKT